jgi:exopolysaccharide production protein ExoZ
MISGPSVLSTQTNPQRVRGKLSGVEALRGIAAIMVVTIHASHMLHIDAHTPFGAFWQFGRAGVDFFFVLSGFIITHVHVGDFGYPQVFLSFWGKRLLRIYPVYWIITALYGAILFVSSTQAEQGLLHIVCSFLLLPEAADPILGVGWSLRHELLFYAIFSVALLQRHLGIALLAAWGVGIAWNMGVQIWSGTPYFGGLIGQIVFRGFNIQFFFGIATALVVRSGMVWRPSMLAVLGGLGFFVTGMYESYGHPVMHEYPIRHLSYAIAATLILYGIATLDRAQRTRVPAMALRLGAASYSIYLIHLPVLHVLGFALRGVRSVIPSELVFIIAVATTVMIATVFSEIVEQPLLKFGRWRYGRVTTKAVGTAI